MTRVRVCVRTARGGHGHFQNRDDYREKICIQIVLQTGHTVNDCREHRGLDYQRGDLRGAHDKKKK